MSILEEFFPLKRFVIAPGAHRMVRLMQAEEGNKALQMRCCLIVGTNGKGTVARLIENELILKGLRVGTYTSPHFIDPLERIRICGQPVAPQSALGAKETVTEWVKSYLPDATFFEITTAIALLCFYRSELDFCVIEAGLGGRFDSTNCLSPEITILTSVGLDHTDRLGKDEKAIAFDKCLASRRGRPLICGFLSAEAEKGMKQALRITGAKLIASASPQIQPHLEQKEQRPEHDPLSPRERNAHTAQCALKAIENLTLEVHRKNSPEVPPCTSQESTSMGQYNRLVSLELPGRFDCRIFDSICQNRLQPLSQEKPLTQKRRQHRPKLQLIFDTCHNPAAAEALIREYKRSRFAAHPFILIFGVLQEKDAFNIFKTLKMHAKSGYICTFNHEASLDLQQALELTLNCSQVFQTLDLKDICTLLTQFAESFEVSHKSQSGEQIHDTPWLITGSFAFVGQVMKELGFNPEPHSIAPI